MKKNNYAQIGGHSAREWANNKKSMTEKEAQKYHGKTLRMASNGMPSSEQAAGCNTCVACLGWPAVTYWKSMKVWSIYCFCSQSNGVSGETKDSAVKRWNEKNLRF